MSHDFETQLKDRLTAVAADVAGSDELYDRAEERHRAHTRNRAITGGLGALAVVALATIGGLWATGTLIDRPQPPIVQQPDPTPTAAASVPPVLVAGWSVLDEAGLPEDHPVREWDEVVRAYPIQRLDGGPFDYRDLVLELRSDRGSLVATLDVDAIVPVAGAEGADSSVELHGVAQMDGVTHALVTRATSEHITVSVHRLEGVGEADVIVASYPPEDHVDRVTVFDDSSEGAPLFVLGRTRGEDGHRLAEVVTVDGSVTKWDAIFPCDCPWSWVTAGAGNVAFVETTSTGPELVVQDDFFGWARRYPLPGSDDPSPRLELSASGLLVNETSTDRWFLDLTTGELTALDHLPPGYVTFAGTAGDEPEHVLPPATTAGWTPLPDASLGHEERVQDTAWGDGTLYVITGVWIGDGFEHRLLAFDPGSAVWTELAPPRLDGARVRDAVWTGRELLVVGQPAGYPADASPVTTGSYDPVAGTWSRSQVPLGGRSGFSVTWTGQELVVWGGWTGSPRDGDGEERVTTHADGAAYDPATGTWRTLAPSPLSPRGDHGAIWNGRRLVVFGGGHAERFESEFVWDERFDRHDAAAYDPATDTWATIQSPGEIGPLVASVWTGEEILYWTGHLGPDLPGSWREPGGIWDPTTGESSPLPAPPFDQRRDSDISQASSAWIEELERWIVWGGTCGEGCNRSFAEGALFDPETGSWTRLDGPEGVVGHGSVAVWGAERLFAVGGYVDALGARDDVVTGAWWRPTD